jgi:hypothetical protein
MRCRARNQIQPPVQLTDDQVKECARHLRAAEASLKRAHELAAKEGTPHAMELFDLAVAAGAQLFVWDRLHSSKAKKAAEPARGEAPA